MSIIKIYMFFVMFFCYPLMFFSNKKDVFKLIVAVSLWLISFSIVRIIKEMGY